MGDKKMTENEKKYYLGLDMGTSSVGWAVTDSNYVLLRKRGKDLWGIREFEEASTAIERRTHRVSRRRNRRSKVRIGLLKDYFHDEIVKVDPCFFIRLKNSKYYMEDKDERLSDTNGIFNDPEYNDADYYKQYPTVFHLRKDLIENDKKHDIRLVYLALENMFKHRGHFLNASLSATDDESGNMYEIYGFFVESLNDLLDLSFPAIDVLKLTDILSNKDYSRSRKKDELLSLYGFEIRQKREIEFIKCICGLNVDAKLLFSLEGEEKITFSFSDYGFDEKSEELFEQIGQDNADIVGYMKQIYDLGCLSGVLKEFDYLSQARVAEYNKHHEDLHTLKNVMKKYCTRDEYDKMFRLSENGSYSAYVNSVNSGEKIRRGIKDRKREDFYKNVKKYLKDKNDSDERIAYIFKEIENETFMPKQLTADNGIIPNQVHLKEMKKILENVEKYYSFLGEKDEYGLSVSERILKIFSFQIPYYIGPLYEESKNNNGNGWVVRKEKGQVFPWNIEDKVDMKKTSEVFISRMVRKCTYIFDEQVLPKASLLYEKFCVLNEINNIKIDGEKISVELKQKIYNDLFETGKKVTRAKLEKYLMLQGALTEKEQLTGVDISINNSLSSYGKFYAVFGNEIKTDSGKDMVERIIFWCTIYGDSKKYLKEQLEDNYPELSSEVIKRILGFKFKDWGNLSKELIELKGCEKGTGEEYTIIRAMWETNYNFMELLHSDLYTFGDTLAEKAKKEVVSLSDLSIDILEDYYFSAPVKRMVWQTLQIIKEITQIMGNEPNRIFIEMTRSDQEKGDKGRKNSREKQLSELYKNIKDDSHQWQEEIRKAGENGKIKSKKMYLYFLQMGKSVYTGEPIDLDKLFDDNYYDIDHIYPRHFVKDDNLSNNLVLVEKTKNSNKSDVYPLEASIRNNQKVRNLWKLLHEKKLMNDEKYRRLCGTNPFTEEQKADFIARQLVETSQATKGVADLLRQVLLNTTIVYAKASNVSDFRHDRDFLKSRIINDMHHAKDAYLNIVVGNVYYTKFTQNPLNYIKNQYMKDSKTYNYNLSKMFERDIIRDGYCAWKASEKGGDAGTIAVVRKMMDKNTPLLTRLNFEGHGAIANETLYGKDKAKPDVYFPLKSNDSKMCDVTKYGGFTSATTAYFFLVEHEKKGKRIRTLEAIPLYLKNKIEKDKDGLYKYCTEELKLINPDVRLKKIKIQSLIRLNGYYAHLSGKTNQQYILRNAVEMCLSQNWNNYIKKLENLSANGFLSETVTTQKNIELYNILLDKHMNSIFSKRPNPIGTKLLDGQSNFEKLDIIMQVQVLMEILKLSSIGLTSANLIDIGGSARCGVMLMGKEISKNTECILINQSITGIYESVIDLLTV